MAAVLAASGRATAAPPASTPPTITELPTSALPPPTSVRRPAEQPFTEEPDTVTTIRITVADQTITAQLADNPTAQDLAAQLPLTLTISDFNRVEKVAELPRPLTMDGVPAGDDPDINDIGYYAPPATSSSTTATSATATASSASAASTTATST